MPTSTSVQTSLSDIPATLKPYFTDEGGILPSAQKLLSQDYNQVYGNALNQAGLAGSGRVAGLSPMQQQIGRELQGMGTPSQFNMGTGMVNQGANMLGQGVNMYGAGANTTGMGIGALSSMTDPNATRMYMSPYQQNVIDVNKQEAMRDYQKMAPQMGANAVKLGAFGGTRQAVESSEAQRNLQTKLGNIQATGMQNAFDAAQKAQLGSAQAYGQLGQNFGMYGQGLGQLGQNYGQLGATLGQLGTAQQATDIDRLKTQGAYGDLQRGLQQQQLDTQYQDIMRQQNYPMERIGTMSNLLRGVPIEQTASTQSNTTPPPSFASQLGGMGLTGLSLYNMFGSKP
jgi:hypothetical protein